MLEIGYSLETSPWFSMTPMVPLFIQPNTRSDLGNVLTVGVATCFSV